MKIGIIGLGLIGGSLGLCLKKRGYADIVYGVDKDPICEEAAKRLGLIDEAVTEDECVEKSDIIIIAIPAGAASSTLIRVLDLFKSRNWQDKIVIDTCSTKERIVLDAKYHPCRKQYVATHPMAGTEYSGPWAAEPNLFDGRACIFVDPGESSPKALKTIEDMYAVLNMRPIYMNADSHDLHLAYVSHISHVTSFALALTVFGQRKRREAYLRFGIRRFLIDGASRKEQPRHVGADFERKQRKRTKGHRYLYR